MYFILFIQLLNCDQNRWGEMKGLLGAFNNLMENELKVSMLDSPDHCEGTLEKLKHDKKIDDKGEEPEDEENISDNKNKDENINQKISMVLEELRKLKAKKAQKESDSDPNVDVNLKRDKINGSKLQAQIDTFNIKDRIIDKLKDRRAKQLHDKSREDVVVPGKPRKIKIVQIVPVPVDEKGEEINE